MEDTAKSGNISMIEHLIAHLQWPIDHQSDHGYILLPLAIKHRDALMWLLSQGADINKQDCYGSTALSCAVHKGPEDVITLLLGMGADIEGGAVLVATLLRNKLEVGDEWGIEMMNTLIAHGAPLNKFEGDGSSLKDSPGIPQLTALYVACGTSHRSLAGMKLLLAHGAVPTLNQRCCGKELQHTSAFDMAWVKGYEDISAVMQEYMSKGEIRLSRSNL